jgi:hypothetical protein
MAGALARRLGELLRDGGMAAGGLLGCVPTAPWWRSLAAPERVCISDAVEAWWAVLGHLLLLTDTLLGGVCMASGESLAMVTPLGATILLEGEDLMTALPSLRWEVL